MTKQKCAEKTIAAQEPISFFERLLAADVTRVCGSKNHQIPLIFAIDQKTGIEVWLYCGRFHSNSTRGTMVAELQIQKYHVFFENIAQPGFGFSRDDAGVLCIKVHRLRLSIYGRKFKSMWK